MLLVNGVLVIICVAMLNALPFAKVNILPRTGGRRRNLISIALQVGVPLPQQSLGLGVGADLPAAVAATTREAIPRGTSALECCGPIAPAAMAKIPGWRWLRTG